MLNQLYFYIFSKPLHVRYITEGTIELISEGFTSCTNETIQLFSEKNLNVFFYEPGHQFNSI